MRSDDVTSCGPPPHHHHPPTHPQHTHLKFHFFSAGASSLTRGTVLMWRGLPSFCCVCTECTGAPLHQPLTGIHALPVAHRHHSHRTPTCGFPVRAETYPTVHWANWTLATAQTRRAAWQTSASSRASKVHTVPGRSQANCLNYVTPCLPCLPCCVLFVPVPPV